MAEQRTTTVRPRRGHGGMRGMGGTGEKAKDFKGTIKKLLQYIGRYKKTIIIVWILAIGSTVMMVVGPKVLGHATDQLVNGLKAMYEGTGGVDFAAIGGTMMWMVLLYAFSSVLMALQGLLMANVTTRVTYNMRRDMEDKIHRLPFKFYDGTTHGEVLTHFTNDVDTVGQSLNQSLTQIITSVVQVVGILLMMLTISWQMTLVALAIIPVTVVLALIVIKNSQKHYRNQQAFLGHVNGHIEEMYDCHLVVRAFNGEEASVKKFDESNDTLYGAAWKASFLSALIFPIMNVISNLGYVVITVLGGYLAANGSVTLGGIQSFLQYVRQFNQPIMQLSNISNILQQTAAAAERIFEFLAEEDETPDAADQPVLAGHQMEGSVKFDNVTFGYNPELTIIHHFSADIQPGQKVAIVGPTGAGKTTIVKLLMRFYELNSGAINIDGFDISKMKRDELREQLGMVLQDTWLFNGTIADNIRYGRLDATDDEVKAAARAALVHHFIRTQPEGYNTILNEEASNVSQGQKQLLTIARAILADPPILILDEATSSVDTRTEMQIQKAMDNLMHGRTSFVIAHRLSTIRNADLILVMDKGDIVEQGTHDELMEKGGFYANLYASQFEVEDAG